LSQKYKKLKWFFNSILSGRRAKKRKQASLCYDNVSGGRGWHNRELKLKKI
jgi:hypothetical protein